MPTTVSPKPAAHPRKRRSTPQEAPTSAVNNHLRTLEIEGYRGFAHLVLDDLADVNLIAGKNSSGKTAAFEGLVLLGNPARILTSLALNEARGMKRLGSNTLETYEYHFNKDSERGPIRIAGSGRSGDYRELEIRSGQGAELIEPDQTTATGALLQQDVVRFDYRRTPDVTAWAISSVAAGADKELVVGSSELPAGYVIPYSSNTGLYRGVHHLYTAVAKEGLQSELLAAVRAVVNDIADIQLLTYAGEPCLYARAGKGPLMPLQMFGTGVGHVAAWVLLMLVTTDSILAVDEIESGIHHSALADVWHSLLQVAQSRNVQLFATTHSYEAIKALEEASTKLGKKGPSVKLIRLQRLRGEIVVVDYDEAVLAAAVRNGIEVR